MSRPSGHGRGSFFSWDAAWELGPEAVGGKGWNLARLTRFGFPVPEGGTLVTAAYDRFVEEAGLAAALADAGREMTAESAATDEVAAMLASLRERIVRSPVPAAVADELSEGLARAGLLKRPLAVRSSQSVEDSPAASFAGVHASFLNVRGRDAVLAAVRGCYASLWTPQALAYRRRVAIEEDGLRMAVVVMALVEARAAGVAFSCDPADGRNLVVVAANLGLGESVVGGSVDADEYRIDQRFRLVDARVGRKQARTVLRLEGGTELVPVDDRPEQVLGDVEIARLARLVVRVFDALGEGERHQDVEWVFDGRDFFLVHARPMTALTRQRLPALSGQPAIWSNANFREVVPNVPSTASVSLVRLALEELLFASFRAGGYPIPTGLPGWRLLGGRLYFNLSLLQWLFFDAFGVPPRTTNEAMGGHQQEIDLSDAAGDIRLRLTRARRLVRLLVATGRARRKSQRHIAELEAAAAEALHRERTTSTDGECREALSEVDRMIAGLASDYMLVGGLFNGSYTALVALLEKASPGRGRALANALLAGAGRIVSAEAGYRLVRIAEIARADPAAARFLEQEPFLPGHWNELPDGSPFKQAFAAFLGEFGHRGVDEGELANPRWREDPSYPLQVVRDSFATASLDRVREQQRERSEEAQRELRQRLPAHRRPLARFHLRGAIAGAELRERWKSTLIELNGVTRSILLDVGRRFAERGIAGRPEDVFHCSYAEIVSLLEGEWDGTGLRLLVEHRRLRRRELVALDPPDLIVDDVPRRAAAAAPDPDGALTGVAAPPAGPTASHASSRAPSTATDSAPARCSSRPQPTPAGRRSSFARLRSSRRPGESARTAPSSPASTASPP